MEPNAGYKKIQWDFIGTGVLLVFIASLLTSVLPSFLPSITSKLGLSKDQSKVVFVPPLTQEGVQTNKANTTNLFDVTAKLNIAKILTKPISTPPFVTDSSKLKNYLEKNSVEINIHGDISEAYLYLKTGPIDVTSESVYFFIVDGHSKQGHLVSSESISGSSINEFLYDMSKLPLSQLPFPLENSKQEVNVITEFLNQDLDYKKDPAKRRQYFVGGFVSTTRLPNQISEMEIRYQCKVSQNCSIVVGSQ